MFWMQGPKMGPRRCFETPKGKKSCQFSSNYFHFSMVFLKKYSFVLVSFWHATDSMVWILLLSVVLDCGVSLLDRLTTNRQTGQFYFQASLFFFLIPIINWHRIVLRQCEAMFAWWTVFMAWTCLVPCLPTLSWLAQQLHAPTRKDWRLQMRHLDKTTCLKRQKGGCTILGQKDCFYPMGIPSLPDQYKRMNVLFFFWCGSLWAFTAPNLFTTAGFSSPSTACHMHVTLFLFCNSSWWFWRWTLGRWTNGYSKFAPKACVSSMWLWATWQKRDPFNLCFGIEVSLQK